MSRRWRGLEGCNRAPPSVPSRPKIGLHRGYPLCQERPVSSRSEGGQADPLTLCAAKLSRRASDLRPSPDPLCTAKTRACRQALRPTPLRKPAPARGEENFEEFPYKIANFPMLASKGRAYHQDTY